MKAQYKKPLLVLEIFSPSQAVARDCGDTLPKEQLTMSDPHTCVWDLGGGMSVFVAGSACILDGESMGFACYNNPTEDNYIFRS